MGPQVELTVNFDRYYKWDPHVNPLLPPLSRSLAFLQTPCVHLQFARDPDRCALLERAERVALDAAAVPGLLLEQVSDQGAGGGGPRSSSASAQMASSSSASFCRRPRRPPFELELVVSGKEQQRHGSALPRRERAVPRRGLDCFLKKN